MNRIVCKREPNGNAIWVRLDGVELPPGPSQRMWNHSPDGFNIGYNGSGPAQLALALLMVFTSNENAVRLHQKFKEQFLGKREYFGATEVTIEVDIPEWIAEHTPVDAEAGRS